MISYACQVQNRSLSEFFVPTVATRAAGLDASEFVKGDQAALLFRLLVERFPDGLSNNDLSRLSGIKISSVTARIMELRQHDVVEPYVTRSDSVTGVANVVWRVNPTYFKPSTKIN